MTDNPDPAAATNTNRPVYKLSRRLIDTYKHINEVNYFAAQILKPQLFRFTIRGKNNNNLKIKTFTLKWATALLIVIESRKF